MQNFSNISQQSIFLFYSILFLKSSHIENVPFFAQTHFLLINAESESAAIRFGATHLKHNSNPPEYLC
jgi:hypothetical protein